MKSVLVTGASGMLGATIVSSWQKKFNVFATGSSDFDDNPAQKYKVFDLKLRDYSSLSNWVTPDYIVHCAAITSHEYCQKNPKETMLVNAESVKKLLHFFNKSKIIFISTDAVFPPRTHLAKENTKTLPITVYGKSKELGEKYILSAKKGYIVRTTIVGTNINKKKQSFAEWIMDNLKAGKNINLYDHVYFTPISIWRFARELKFIMEGKKKFPQVLHIAGSEVCSKFDFGQELCRMMDLDHSLITKKHFDDRGALIKRSKDQSLSVKLYERLSSRNLPKLLETIKDIYERAKLG